MLPRILNKKIGKQKMCKNLLHKLLLFNLIIFGYFSSNAQSISINTTSYTADQLVKDIFVGNNQSCIAVDNINIYGKEFGGGKKSWGYFNKNNSSLAFNEGIILSTGMANLAVGPNSSLQDEKDSSWKSDPDLFDALKNAGLPTDNLLNATVLEFDFISKNKNSIAFEYMFLSEEYRPDNCNYSDAFAFLIKKADNTEPFKNIAVVPGTNIPVTSLTINGAETCPSNIQYFGSFNDSRYPTHNFNGETKVLKAIANIEVGVKYRMKLVISDHGDIQGRYDSAVFLKGRSFGNKDLGRDWTENNGNALCPGENRQIDATEIGATKYTWYKDGVQILSGNFPTYLVKYEDAGYYEVEIELNGACSIKGQINIEGQTMPNFMNTTFKVCDEDFDNIYNVNLDDENTKQILDSHPNFQIRYYENEPINTNNPNEVPINKISFTTNSKSVWIWVKPGNCDPVTKEITFSKNSNSTPKPHSDIAICDDKLEGYKEIDLLDYYKDIADNIEGIPQFYKTEEDAKKQNNVLNSTKVLLTSTSQNKYYIRYNQPNKCDDIEEITFILKQPAKSNMPKEVKICKNTTTTLDAGEGPSPSTFFTSYEWSFKDPITQTNATTQKIENVPVGVYTVKLGYNACFYTQTVEVKQAPTAIIDAIEINGSTVTVKAIGGTAPYKYSLDDNTFPGSFQDSSIFKNVSLGNHTIYVKSSDDCGLVSRDFSVVNIANVISPNADGKNDVINLSELLNKTEARFKVYNRNGVLVFEGNSANQFIWDGKQNGRVLPTGTYWYVADWIEPTSGKTQQLKSWILLKNY